MTHPHDTSKGQQAQHELRQAVAGAVIDIIESAAKTGFKCLVSTGEWCLFAVLVKMEFDTKERTKFFGLARERACAIGSGPRKGRSALRKCSPHASRPNFKRRRLIIEGDVSASDGEIANAEESLSRKGIHPHRRCTALMKCQHAILKWPGRLYHGLVAFDVMHILYLNWIKYLQEVLLSTMTKTQHKLLDRRVHSFSPFLNPDDGETRLQVNF